MLTQQTLDKLNAMKLGAMAAAFQKQLQTDEAAQLQRFASVQGIVQNIFRVSRHLLRSAHHRLLRTRAFVRMGCGYVRLLRTIGSVDFTGQERAVLNKLTMPPGKTIEGRIRGGLVLTNRKRMQRRAKQTVEQHVAGSAVEFVRVVDALFQLDVNVHPKLPRAGSGKANEVRLHRPGYQHGIGATGLRLAEMELKLAHLVSPERQPGAVVALDPELNAEGRAKIRGGVERRRRVAEPDPRPGLFDGSECWQ